MQKEERQRIVAEMDQAATTEENASTLKVPSAGEIAIIITSAWPLIKMALKLAKFFTGPKADKKIDEIIKDIDELIPG